MPPAPPPTSSCCQVTEQLRGSDTHTTEERQVFKTAVMVLLSQFEPSRWTVLGAGGGVSALPFLLAVARRTRAVLLQVCACTTANESNVPPCTAVGCSNILNQVYTERC